MPPEASENAPAAAQETLKKKLLEQASIEADIYSATRQVHVVIVLSIVLGGLAAAALVWKWGPCAFIPAFLLFLFFLYGLVDSGSDKGTKTEALRRLSLEIAVLRQTMPATAKSADYFRNLVEMNSASQRDYLAIAKKRARISLGFALVWGVLGVALILFAIFKVFQSPSSTEQLKYVTSASAILMMFFSGLCFVLYAMAVRRQERCQDSLTRSQNFLLSFSLLEQTKDRSEFEPMMRSMVEALLSSDPRPPTHAPAQHP